MPTTVRPAQRSSTSASASVHATLLLRAQATGELAETLDVHSAQLLDEDVGGLAANLELGPERRRRGAARCWRDDRGRDAKKLICLDDDPAAGPCLLAPAARR